MANEVDCRAGLLFYDLRHLTEDRELIHVVQSCVEQQKRIGARNLKEYFKPNDQARYYVSKEELDRILQSGEDISDIRTHTEITNCIVFHTTNLNGSLLDERVLKARRQADELVMERIKRLFRQTDDLSVEVSGHFWYPPGGFMGWHTNLRKPGWRMYVNYCEEEGKSFFRYRDPDTGEIVTAHDRTWNFRLFRITPAKPFWHCVYSDTHRFSLGYKIEQDGQ